MLLLPPMASLWGHFLSMSPAHELSSQGLLLRTMLCGRQKKIKQDLIIDHCSQRPAWRGKLNLWTVFFLGIWLTIRRIQNSKWAVETTVQMMTETLVNVTLPQSHTWSYLLAFWLSKSSSRKGVCKCLPPWRALAYGLLSDIWLSLLS
jgi:hypothetical protein